MKLEYVVVTVVTVLVVVVFVPVTDEPLFPPAFDFPLPTVEVSTPVGGLPLGFGLPSAGVPSREHATDKAPFESIYKEVTF